MAINDHNMNNDRQKLVAVLQRTRRILHERRKGKTLYIPQAAAWPACALGSVLVAITNSAKANRRGKKWGVTTHKYFSKHISINYADGTQDASLILGV
jgi:hypothetical protein